MESASQISSSFPSFPDDLAAGKEQDAFLAFVEHARSAIFPDDLESDGGDDDPGPSWSWIVSRIIKTCASYSSGVTPAILLSDLSQAWNDQRRYGTSKKKREGLISLDKKHRRMMLPNTVTIDSILEKNFVSPNCILESVIVDAFVLPGTNIYMLTLGDLWSSSTIDMYLHRRYYHLVDPDSGILRKGREICLTGCRLRKTMGVYRHSRLLPTEYLVILLNEDQDEDAMLLGAQFCSDSFSSISVDAFKNGITYSFYARIESIGQLELLGSFGGLQRKRITLVDNDGFKLNFLLWGEQVLLSNLFSTGSMLALDRPFISDIAEGNAEANQEICLEYGSATQLYLVPFIQHEEQVLLASTQMQCQGSTPSNAVSLTRCPKISQVLVPLNSEGLMDLSNYPFRSYVTDLQSKMSGISLYGAVANIKKEDHPSGSVFSMEIEDITGAITARLYFVSVWTLGWVGIGHMVYVSGLSCSLTKENLLEVSWFEKGPGAAFVNLSCLPALLSSPCLHKLSYLSDITSQRHKMHICKVCLEHIELHYLHSVLCHTLCGHHVKEISDGSVVCNFCCCSCDGDIVHNFYFSVSLVDKSGKVFAWCTGQTASELLQISPDEFCGLPEAEQAMYLYTLGTDSFIVSLACSKRQGAGSDPQKDSQWEIVRAQKNGSDDK